MISVDFTPLFLYYVIVFDIVSVLSVLDEKNEGCVKSGWIFDSENVGSLSWMLYIFKHRQCLTYGYFVYYSTSFNI